jgi:hypothetical protein
VAREQITKYTDDLDSSQEASEVRTIGYGGFLYELDLTEEHAKELDTALEGWLEAAHLKVKWGKRIQTLQKAAPPVVKQRRKPPTLTAEERREIRQWGRENGLKVAARGILSPDVIKAYKKAHRVTKPAAAKP